MKSKPFQPQKIWIDIDNTPHVPFFAPIIEGLANYGFPILLTARDAYQVTELVRLFNMPCRIIGRHYGKSTALKVAGTFIRAAQLTFAVASSRPALALSHGSRAQLYASMALRIPSVVIFDYEFAKGPAIAEPTWIMTPDVIPNSDIPFQNAGIYKYSGIKEDVYVPRFRPDVTIKSQLGLRDESVVVTVRPPANEAHYHCQETELLFCAVMEFLGTQHGIQVVLLPRNERQKEALQNQWPTLLASGKVIIPDRALDGLNLLWYSDLAISGGGTMNREAAALGVPVYSIFRGKIGAVDRHLAQQGHMVLLETPEEIKTKIVLSKRDPLKEPANRQKNTLDAILENILLIAGSQPSGRNVAA